MNTILKALPLRAAAAVGIAVFSIFGLGACGAAGDNDPMTTTGTWVSTDDSHAFVSEITGGTIEIYITTSGDKSLYWAGTFKDSVKDNTSIISAANTDQLKTSMLGSQDPTKEFTVRGGNIYFDMSMMGTKKNVELQKNSSSTN